MTAEKALLGSIILDPWRYRVFSAHGIALKQKHGVKG